MFVCPDLLTILELHRVRQATDDLRDEQPDERPNPVLVNRLHDEVQAYRMLMIHQVLDVK